MQDKSALIVIPTTGASTLVDAVNSAINQTHINTTCLVIIDGPEFEIAANKILDQFPTVKRMTLPWNTGGSGWYGHRIYFLSAPLIDQDYWLALDQDNWFEPDHVGTMIDACERNNWRWCHSLRKIHDHSGRYICDDDCESLGRWPVYISDQHHLVDTNTYCIRKDVIVNMAPAWYSGWGGDRQFYSIITQHVQDFGCTGKATVNYRLDGNPNSVKAEFFIKGNEIMRQRYQKGFPWRM
jgi:glycosyltransferase involved in cell wall biosynthesis